MPPTVSICCVTYNHAATVAQALDSFLAQQGDVTIEVLVHDDASTDGTQEILERYASLYPDVVKPLYETENQYRKGTAMDATFNFPRATGEYIALCEGDDTWSDPHKLHKQISAMRAHPDCTFCFTNGMVRDESGKTPDREFIPYYPEEAAWYTPATREYTLGEITRLSFLPTASFLFPRAALARVPAELLLSPCPSGDLRLKLCLTAVGKALYLHESTCVYRFNAPSSAMARWGAEAPEKTHLRCAQVIAMLEGVDSFSGDRCHAELARLMDAQRLVLLAAAPTRAMLNDAQIKRVYRALPPLGRLKCRLKILLPAPVFMAIRRLVH